MDLIESRPEHPWTITELATSVGISVRSIEDGFRRHVGISPMGYLRRCRLDRAHGDLREASPATVTVGEVAYRWGFAHVGRFARAYRERFGQNPSETLRSLHP
ncbi:helix-turn-helix transcriptional regulator [Pseudonocardia hispaniensis]|uniref:Helix-turn-helix transcriptional regulator n=1 Tax=Pseudonocardia hispaniensis TaxID=904933 RepID=A0ABW1IZB0_9PSEU